MPFSQDGDFVICGSENGSVYVWNKARFVFLSDRIDVVTSFKKSVHAADTLDP